MKGNASGRTPGAFPQARSAKGFLMLQKKITEYGLRVYPALLLFTLFLVSSASAHTSLRVEWREERLSVSAEKVTLAQILQEVARRTGMEIRGLAGLQEQVCVRFARLPLHEALQKLAMNYVVVWKTFPQKGQQPVQALVSRPKVLSLSQALPCEAIPNAEGTKPKTEPMIADAQAEKGPFDPDSLIQEAASALLAGRDRQRAVAVLLDATKSDQVERRLQALQFLYQTDQVDEGAVLSALSAALTDEDLAVKGYAIRALADRGGANALGYLRQAFRDPDPAVRMQVVEQAALQDRGLPLLQEALTDNDEAVRSLASSLVSGRQR